MFTFYFPILISILPVFKKQAQSLISAGSNFFISSITFVIVNPVSTISSMIITCLPLMSFFNPDKALTIPVDSYN